MSEAATAERPNKVEVADAGPSRKKIRIEIPAETVDEKLAESLDTLSAEAALPGFRPGKAPKALIRKRFGAAMLDETKGQLIASAYTRAIEDNSLKVIGDPVVEGIKDLKLEEGKPLAFDVEIEVIPDFEMPSIEGIKVRKPLVNITDEMVDKELEKLCINEGDLEERQSPEPGDYLTGHGIMKGKGKAGEGDGEGEAEFYNLNGCVVRMPLPEDNGKGMILGVAVEDFSAQLGTPKPGDTVTIKVKGPENHEVEGIRGNDLTITFTVQRIDRIIPADPDKVVASYGMDSVDQLKEAIRARLFQRGMIEQSVVMRNQVAEHLIKNTKMDLPERLTAIQAGRNLERLRMEYMYRGIEPLDAERLIADRRASSDERTRNDLKMFFVLDRAADEMKIGVTEHEVNGRIAQMAQQRNMRPERLKSELYARNQIGQIAMQIREHKTMDAILAKASVEEMEADAFKEAMKADKAG
jgi:trigger factor